MPFGSTFRSADNRDFTQRPSTSGEPGIVGLIGGPTGRLLMAATEEPLKRTGMASSPGAVAREFPTHHQHAGSSHEQRPPGAAGLIVSKLAPRYHDRVLVRLGVACGVNLTTCAVRSGEKRRAYRGYGMTVRGSTQGSRSSSCTATHGATRVPGRRGLKTDPGSFSNRDCPMPGSCFISFHAVCSRKERSFAQGDEVGDRAGSRVER